MSIEIHQTPNPNALKFVLPSRHFDKPLNVSIEDETEHPLARQLLALESVYNVFMVQDFVTVNKVPGVGWKPLQEEIQRILQKYFHITEP